MKIFRKVFLNKKTINMRGSVGTTSVAGRNKCVTGPASLCSGKSRVAARVREFGKSIKNYKKTNKYYKN